MEYLAYASLTEAAKSQAWTTSPWAFSRRESSVEDTLHRDSLVLHGLPRHGHSPGGNQV